MCMYCDLLTSIDKLIAKDDSDLEKTLSDAGYAQSGNTVKAISDLEESIVTVLAGQTAELQKILDKAAKEGLSFKEISTLVDNMLSNGTLDKDAAKLLGDLYVDHVAAFADDYIKKIDEDMACESLTKRTVANYEDWTASYAKMFKDNADAQVKEYIERAYKNGMSVSDLAKDIYDYGFRDEYWQAKRIAQTELLRCHGFAKNEAIMQSPVCDEKEWIHTGAVKNKPRQNHVDMNGVKVPKADNFVLIGADGKIYYPKFPKDPVLPAIESVNCHCYSRGVINTKYLKYNSTKKKELQNQFIKADNKQFKLEQAMKINLPDEIYDVKGIKESHVREVNRAVSDLQKEYDIKLDLISVEEAEKGDIMLAGGYQKEDGTLGYAVVVNKGYNFRDIDKRISTYYRTGRNAGKNLYDYTQHELCHIMCVQDCQTVKEYNDRLKEIDKKFIKGISGYADKSQKGTESLAEAFVRKRNGETIPKEADDLLKEYIEKWRL